MPALGGGQRFQQFVQVLHIVLQHQLDGAQARRGERHDDAAPVVGVGVAHDQARLFKPVQAVGHRAGCQQQGFDQLLRIHRVGGAGPVQRGQHVEFALVQIVAAKTPVHVAGGECVQAEHAGDHRHGGEVLAGTFLVPLRNRLIDEVIHKGGIIFLREVSLCEDKF
ncbi:hypothetical protein D3C72_1807280 [compost metagenome]